MSKNYNMTIVGGLKANITDILKIIKKDALHPIALAYKLLSEDDRREVENYVSKQDPGKETTKKVQKIMQEYGLEVNKWN